MPKNGTRKDVGTEQMKIIIKCFMSLKKVLIHCLKKNQGVNQKYESSGTRWQAGGQGMEPEFREESEEEKKTIKEAKTKFKISQGNGWKTRMK